MKINNFDNPIFIFLFCIFALFVNTLSSVYFFPIFLLGSLFIAFFVCLKKAYYYSLSLVMLTILLIELNNGFKPLSVLLLVIFIYVFIAPYIKRVLSFNSLNSFIYIAIFYLGIYILWVLNNEITAQLNYTLLINLIIDFIIFGVLI
ncbi:MAG: hypothetical protein C0625_13900 [Arcobacter sp.]|nr:MAG: hypothetical protein C0625_13900 [Arcobacter sp.]